MFTEEAQSDSFRCGELTRMDGCRGLRCSKGERGAGGVDSCMNKVCSGSRA